MGYYRLTRKALFRQILLALCSSLGFLATGLLRGFSSPAIPSMERISPHLLVDPQAISWLTSSAALGGVFGSLFAMPWLHYMGSKRVLQIIGPVCALSWVGIAMSHNSFPLLIIFRVCTGIASGVSIPGAQVYISECSHPKVRGLLTSLPSVMLSLGTIIQFLFGFVLDWRGMAWASVVFPAAMALVLIPFPESPPWLKLNGKEGYQQANDWLGLNPDMERYVDAHDESNQRITEPEPSVKIHTPFCSRNVLMPLFLGLSICIFQQTCANDIVIFNASMIFRSSGSTIDSSIASLIVGVVQFFFGFLSIFLIDKFGRKVLLIFSSSVMGIFLGSLSYYFYLLQVDKASNLSLLPLISLMSYIAAYSLGFSTIPYIFLGELYPLAYRSILGPLTTSVSVIAMFLELKTYSDLVSFLGLGGTFTFYSFMNFFAAFFIYFLVPETKCKSLDEIEYMFKRPIEGRS